MTESPFVPDTDLGHAYPVLAAADAAVRAQDLAALDRLWNETTAWNERCGLIGQAIEAADEAYWRQVAQDRPHDPLALTLLGACLIQVGWSIRGHARGSQVGADRWHRFKIYLRESEQYLIQACAIDPGFVPAWLSRLNTARGLGAGVSEARRRFSRIVAVEAHLAQAETVLLQMLCPKWYGSWPEATAFASACAEEAAAGQPNAAIVAELHLEHWFARSDEKTYFADPAVRQEIDAAAARSIGHPDFSPTYGWVGALSRFALAYSVMADWTKAKDCFTRLGDHLDLWMWNYFTEPLKKFATWRTMAMERG